VIGRRRVPVVRRGLGRRVGLWLWHHPLWTMWLLFVARMVWERGL
jgi:hypothetical protein